MIFSLDSSLQRRSRSHIASKLNTDLEQFSRGSNLISSLPSLNNVGLNIPKVSWSMDRSRSTFVCPAPSLGTNWHMALRLGSSMPEACMCPMPLSFSLHPCHLFYGHYEKSCGFWVINGNLSQLKTCRKLEYACVTTSCRPTTRAIFPAHSFNLCIESPSREGLSQT